MASPARPARLTLPIAPAGGALAALAAALACLCSPVAWIEAAVVRSGLPALLPAAAPPLGWTARGALALAGAAGVAAVVWAVLVLLLGERRIALAVPASPRARREGVPAVRRADSHPDAPPRAPIRAARDFGPLPASAGELPVPSLPGERSLPADLDTPLAAYATAGPPAPAAPKPAPVALAPGERISSVELTPDTRDEPASLDALLARLERGARGMAGARPARPGGITGFGGDHAALLDEALGTLRRSAATA